MRLIDLLDSLFIQPLLRIYSVVFDATVTIAQGPGVGLIGFSVLLNLALLPVYYQMERAGRKGSERRDAMSKEIARIKAHYRGRERYFYIRTIHRQFGYRPISAVVSSSDLYLQILVFATVYRFLAAHPVLQHTSFFVIADLSRPDAILFGVNVLPILMTLINALSVVLYVEDKAKRRTGFLLAGLFLVLLYASPSGLVLYWTCNNAFSLVRNLVVRRLSRAIPSRWIDALSLAAKQE
ncbi:MAG: YidC/Oxa1 family membrane protein insertase [Polyangiaceae bacterium]|nr:YidC/Oxa1 family membrane protein insertase [Polyangiaceae bacterium]